MLSYAAIDWHQYTSINYFLTDWCRSQTI